MTESPHIVQLDEQNFMSVVVEGSDAVPVLVDFWADWCGPCKALSPVLEKLAVEYDGAFVLAMLDTEAHPGIAQQLGIRSMPTVKLFRNRQLVDEFVGALPEAEVRRFLETHVEPLPDVAPAEAEAEALSPLATALALQASGRTAEARTLLKQLRTEEPENADVLLALGQISATDGDLDTADSCVQALPEAARDGAAGKRLIALLALARDSAGNDDAATLAKRLDADPDNAEAQYQLAIAKAVGGEVQEGMDLLLGLVMKKPDLDDGGPQRRLLELFDVLGEDPLAGQYRRKLFAVLH